MQEPKEEIKQRLDVVEVVSGYIQLKNAGQGSYKACCPFHTEKTPSFYVSSEKQIWHCFGCNKGGDLFSFIMEIEGVDFSQALEIAAQKAGVKLPEHFTPQSRLGTEKDKMLELNLIAQKLYEKVLTEHERATIARNYIEKRRITKDEIKKFGIGYAPMEWTMLSDYLRKRGYKDADILSAGLAKKKINGNGILDRFRDRIMIPLYDSQGRVVGFTGRSLSEDKNSGPKYLNSPETLIYNKRAILYGLHLAKTQIRQNKSVIVVEGNLDVVASHRAGVENIVASSGTALTDIQLQILKKLTDNIIFCFDGDGAGYEAAKRGIDLAIEMDFNVRAICIPKELGKDTDDVVCKDPQAWRNLVSEPLHIMQFYFNREFTDANMSDINKKKRIVDFLLSKINLYSSLVEREHWLMHLSDRTRIDINQLRSELKVDTKQTEEKVQQKKDDERVISKKDKAIEMLIGICLVDNSRLGEFLITLKDVNAEDKLIERIVKDVISLYTNNKFAANAQNKLFSTLRSQYSQEGNEKIINFIDKLALQTELYLSGNNEKQVRENIDCNIQTLIQIPQKQRLLEFERKIRQAEMTGQTELARSLITEYAQVIESLKHDK
jgi:DNA primase